jgi:hypothetical protein
MRTGVSVIPPLMMVVHKVMKIPGNLSIRPETMIRIICDFQKGYTKEIFAKFFFEWSYAELESVVFCKRKYTI